jgi:hypothetical protein
MGLKATVVSINDLQPFLPMVDVLIITWQMLELLKTLTWSFISIMISLIAVENED